MRQPIKNLVGMRFGRWVVQSQAGRNRHGQLRWLSVCDCGVERVVGGNQLKRGRSRSCGCIRGDRIERRRKAKALIAATLLRERAS
jgi:hypothetical protein